MSMCIPEVGFVTRLSDTLKDLSGQHFESALSYVLPQVAT